MAEIINLRNARKARARAAESIAADENRVRFGRTATERKRDRIEADRTCRSLDAAKLDEDGATSP